MTGGPPRDIILADRTFVGGRLVPEVKVAVSGGRIEAVGRIDAAPTRRFAGKALLPGFVSAHSHAFQRALRGRGESFPDGAGSFWSWREAMYELVECLDRDAFFEATRSAYREMRAAGITTVGEFHYLHHSAAGPDFAFDSAIVDAAREAGIRVVVLSTYYRTGGIGSGLEGAQRRFGTIGPNEFWASVDRLAAATDGRASRVGVAAHSIRAVPVDELEPLHREARRRGMVFHMHLDEQRAEIDASLQAYGRRPSDVVLDELAVDGGFTAIHGTHTTEDGLAALFAAGGSVCVCPTTEANLGDGIPAAAVSRGRLCLGTDSNARISMVEEMRWLEYGQRLSGEMRGAFAGGDGEWVPRVLDIATRGGADGLGVRAGRIEAGCAADFVLLDLEHPQLAGAPDPLAAWVTGGDDRCIAGTAVGGRWDTESTAMDLL